MVKRKGSVVQRINDGLTIGRLAAGIVGVSALFGAVWGLDQHFETRADSDAHAKKDDQRSAWTNYGLRNNRLEYLADKQAECDQRKLVAQLSAVDSALCARFEAQFSSVGKEVADLKNEAMKGNKEKP